MQGDLRGNQLKTGAEQSKKISSGKSAADENFPVGSVLLPARLRPHVAAFYRLARTMDDIADAPDLPETEKLLELDRYAAALRGEITTDPMLSNAYKLVSMSVADGVPLTHMEDLISAFRQDAVKQRYANWAELQDYCSLSASPVGRFLLDLHGEHKDLFALSDPLCDALQVLNHLQDLKQDFDDLGRIYLPADWMVVHAVKPADIRGDRATPGLRAVIHAALDRCDEMLKAARPLSSQLRSRRLAMETAVIWRLANRLSARLRRDDPIAQRVALSKIDFAFCSVRGAVAGFVGKS